MMDRLGQIWVWNKNVFLVIESLDQHQMYAQKRHHVYWIIYASAIQKDDFIYENVTWEIVSKTDVSFYRII